MKRLILWLVLVACAVPAVAQEPPTFFDKEQYQAFKNLLGEPGARSLDSRFSVLNASGPQGGNVSADSFGAKGDGITDDTAAVNRAIAALGNRGTVWFGRKTYILQGVNLVEGIYFRGVGARSAVGGIGATRLRLPASPTAGVPMFRVLCDTTSGTGYTDLSVTIANSTDIVTSTAAHGWTAGQPVLLSPKNGPMPTGGSVLTVLYAGEPTNGGGLAATGTTMRLYDTSAHAVAGGATGVTNFTTDGFVFTAATTDVVTSNWNGFRVGTAVQAASTTTLPAGLSAATTYYVGRPNGTTFYLYTSEANAITGDATGLVDITDTGTGTHTIYRTAGATLGLRAISTINQWAGGGIFDCELDGRANSGAATPPTDMTSETALRVAVDFTGVNIVEDFHMERCYVHNFDFGYRDSVLGNTSNTFNACRFAYNWVGINASENPLLVNCWVGYNFYGLAGRLLDFSCVNNYFVENYVGVSGYAGYIGRWAGNTSSTAGSSVVNGQIIGGVIFANQICGVVLTGNSSVIGALITGDNADSSFDGSIGVKIQGQGSSVTGCTFGEGTAGSSFSRCAILLDTAASSTCVDTRIAGNSFYLVGCPAIEGGNTQTSLYGTGNYGTVAQVNITGNTFVMGNHRAVRLTTGNGTGKWFQFINNTVDLIAGTTNGKTNVLASGEGMVEGQFWQSQFNNNYFNNSAGTTTVCGMKQLWGSSTPGCQFHSNRFLASSGTAAGIAFAAAVDANTSIQSNTFFAGSTGMTFASTNAGVIKNNINYVTEFAGSVALNGTTAVTVAHGMAVTPPITSVIITPQDDLGTILTVWVESVDATNITIDATGSGTPTVNVRASWSP